MSEAQNRSQTTTEWRLLGLQRATPMSNDVVLRIVSAKGTVREIPLSPLELGTLAVHAVKELDYLIASVELGP